MVKNNVHALVDKYGYRHEFSDLFGKRGLEWLNTLELSASDKLMLHNHLDHLVNLNQQIQRVDEEIHNKACEDDDVRLLLSLTGVHASIQPCSSNQRSAASTGSETTRS
jgi:transposase